jgi:double-stranded uracil-DNA glycosylase
VAYTNSATGRPTASFVSYSGARWAISASQAQTFLVSLLALASRSKERANWTEMSEAFGPNRACVRGVHCLQLKPQIADSSMSDKVDVLPDLLTADLSIVFCGTAPSRVSKAQRAYYANPRNRFWEIIHECGLTDRKLLAKEYGQLQQFGIGLTDLCKFSSGNDDELPKSAFDADRLLKSIGLHKPRFLAFTSGKAGRVICGNAAQYGRQKDQHGTQIYILPTTSPRRGSVWWNGHKRHWHEFAEAVRTSKST